MVIYLNYSVHSGAAKLIFMIPAGPQTALVIVNISFTVFNILLTGFYG